MSQDSQPPVTPPPANGGGNWDARSQSSPPPVRGDGNNGSGWAAGGTVFAGILMLVTGVMGVLEGIAAIAKDDVYSQVGNYSFEFDLTAWGWIHLILGIIIAVTGWGLLSGQSWAKVTGVALAGLSIILNFIWLPYQPLWALTSIAIGIFVIWALCQDPAVQKDVRQNA